MNSVTKCGPPAVITVELQATLCDSTVQSYDTILHILPTQFEWLVRPQQYGYQNPQTAKRNINGTHMGSNEITCNY